MKTRIKKTEILKTLFSLIALISGSFCIQAQCDMNPFMFNKITSNQTVNGSALVGYWVCEGVHLTVTSSPGLVYLLEQNATINFTGSDGDAIWAKNGCTVTNNSDADLAVSGNIANITLNNNGSGSITPISCSAVTYDYSLTGGSPCSAITSGINDYSGILQIRVYPNPVFSSFTLSIDKDQNFKQFTFILYNMLGEEMKRVENIAQNETEVSRGKLPSGIYMYKLLNESSTVKSGTIIME